MSAAPGRIAVVLGTRPEIIKMAEVIQLLGERVMLVDSGQHWDRMMSGHFFEQLSLPHPEISLRVGGSSRSAQIAETLTRLEHSFNAERPAAVMVQGDTNTVLGGALAANALDIPLVHVEAGLRSFDRAMPEEHNRVLTDHLSDLCLAPTEMSRELLLREGIEPQRISVTGNTIVGAVERALAGGADTAHSMLHRLGLTGRPYVIVTIHRPENTDDPNQLAEVLTGLGDLARRLPVVFPAHPRTTGRIAEFGLGDLLDPFVVTEPLGYDVFVAMCAGAALVVSDSGGVQEEASVWKRPVLVVRRSTERPEVQGTFAELCRDPSTLEPMARALLDDSVRLEFLRTLPSPYGDAGAARRCVDATLALLGADK